MNIISRMLGNLIVVTALLWTFTSFYAEWLVESCAASDRFGNRISLRECLLKNEQLTRMVQSCVERALLKDKITADLMKGELTLNEAAAWFRSLHENPQSWGDFAQPRPGHENGEGWCRMVIDWTDCLARFELSESQADVLRRHLEAELEDRLSSQGGMSLPE